MVVSASGKTIRSAGECVGKTELEKTVTLEGSCAATACCSGSGSRVPGGNCRSSWARVSDWHYQDRASALPLTQPGLYLMVKPKSAS